MEEQRTVDVQDNEPDSFEVEGVTFEISDPDDSAVMEEYLDEDVNELEFERDQFLRDIRPSKVPLVIFGLFLSIAILLLGIAVFSAVSAVQSMGKEVTLTGQVIEMLERRGSDRKIYYYPLVEYTLPDGTVKKYQSSFGSWPPAFETGQQVTVLYNAERLEEVSIHSSDSPVLRFLTTIIAGFIGLGFLGAAMLVRWITKPCAEEVQPGFGFQEEFA